MRRLALTVLALLIASPMARAAFPERPPRIVSGFAAGGDSDLIPRILAEAISPLLGQRVAVENRTGVNGVIGAELVARSAPDGHTAFQCPMSALSITPQLQGANLPLDPRAELVPVSNVALSSCALMVASGSRFQSVAQMLEEPLATRLAADRAKWRDVIRAGDVRAQ